MGRERFLFGEFDTGSNNSNSSDSDDELKDDYWEEISSPSPVTWEPVPYGIPTTCYCGKPVVLQTQTNGLLTGTKFYSCAGDVSVRNKFYSCTIEFAKCPYFYHN